MSAQTKRHVMNLILAFLILDKNISSERLEEPLQCTNYRNLTEKTRNRNTPTARYTLCDNKISNRVWYRFTERAGNILTSKHVSTGMCGTQHPGKLLGGHPCLVYNTTPAQVCFVNQRGECATRANISITFCGKYYVYQLPGIKNCSTGRKRYCGEYSKLPALSCNIATITIYPTTLQTSKPASTAVVEKKVEDLLKQVDGLNNKTDKERSQNAPEIISSLSQTTNFDNVDTEQQENGLSDKTIKTVIQILHKVVNFNISKSTDLKILIPANNILDERNNKSWKSFRDDKEVRTLVTTLENYGFQYAEGLKNNSNIPTFQNVSNIQLHVRYVKNASSFSEKKQQFPFPNASFKVSQDALTSNSSATIVVFWYKTLNTLIPKSTYRGKQREVKTEIITASVKPKQNKTFSTPVRITWNTTPLNDSLTCVFWKPKIEGNNWKDDGCERVKDGNRLICKCNHLTAFACMDISRDRISESDRKALELISTIGCSVSLFAIILTIITHAVLWRRLQQNSKSKVPSQVLIHLCVAIGMTDILAIMAGPAQNNEKFCTAVSILLYFFVLAVFGWMLCEGVVIYLQLVNVYTGLSLGGRHLKVFYVVGWGFPAAVVALLVGLSGRHNFITKSVCWCKTGGVVFYTFVSAVGIILLTNIVIFALALRNAVSSSETNTARSLSAKKGNTGSPKTTVGSTLRKAKVAVKGSAVLLPLLGLTWIFGLLVFNRDVIVFKYLFAIFNSLQGLMIFIFHVLLNKRIHDAISREKKARKAVNAANLVANNTCSTLQTSEGSPGKSSLPGTPISGRKNNNKLVTVKNKYVIMKGNDSLRPDKSNSKAAREVVSEDLELSKFIRL